MASCSASYEAIVCHIWLLRRVNGAIVVATASRAMWQVGVGGVFSFTLIYAQNCCAEIAERAEKCFEIRATLFNWFWPQPYFGAVIAQQCASVCVEFICGMSQVRMRADGHSHWQLMHN